MHFGFNFGIIGSGGDSEPRPYLLCEDVPACDDVWACNTVIEGSTAFITDYGLTDDNNVLLTDDSGEALWAV